MTRCAALAFSAVFVLAVGEPSGIAQTPVARPATRSIWDGVYTDSQAGRGEQLYARHCSRCHGADLTGLPVTPPFPGAKDRTPTLLGALFDTNYNDLPLSDLVERTRISMPQERPGSLPRKDTVDVIAYLLFKSGFPFGREELTDRLDDLRGITIVPYRR
jgi:S-disulfanyl-L-cysteine oxidoreductase SoxD